MPYCGVGVYTSELRKVNNLCDYYPLQLMSDNESLYNTPPTWSIYITKLFLDWLMTEGGMKHFEILSFQKSKLIYDIIDSSQNYFRYASPTVCGSFKQCLTSKAFLIFHLCGGMKVC